MKAVKEMAEYIDREAALAFQNELEPMVCKSIMTDELFSATKDSDLVAFLQNIPSADVAPVKRGTWVDMGDFEQCSVCTGTHLKEFTSYYGKVTWVRSNYCPNCGARMDGDADAEE